MHSLSLLLSLAAVLGVARVGGMLSRRVGLPAVFGELTAGVLLGPAVLGFVQPDDVLRGLGDIGVLFLLFLAGLETDLVMMRHVGRAATAAAVCGVILPLVGGTLTALACGLAPLESVFIGTILTATSVSISAQTLQELGRLRSRVGVTILGAAIIDDVLGVIVLSLVLAFAQGDNPVLPLVRMAAFVGAGLLLGRHFIPPYVHWAHRLHSREAAFALVVVVVLLYSWAAEALGGMAAITGAYLAGVLVGRTELAEPSLAAANTIGYGFLVPIFLVTVGLESQLDGLFANPLFFLAITAVAIGTKIVGCGLGALSGPFSRGDALRIGLGMVSRGEVALVVATTGLHAGIISQGTLGLAVAVTLVTTLVTPVLLQLGFRAGGEPVLEGVPVVAGGAD
jgi:Kef-type K+ transport system membrane component KefB